MGLFIFFIGMMAFNAGSQGSISNLGDGEIIIKVVMNMLFSIFCSTFTALFIHRFITHPTPSGWDVEEGLNGSLIGMVFLLISIQIGVSTTLSI